MSSSFPIGFEKHRKTLGLEPLFQRGHSRHMSYPVELALNDVLERIVAGPSRNLQTAGVVKNNNLLEAVQIKK
jgi:hypothetical protein